MVPYISSTSHNNGGMINLGEKSISQCKESPFDDDSGGGGLKLHPLPSETTSTSN